MEVVIFHSVPPRPSSALSYSSPLPPFHSVPSHAGLLFHNHGQYVYIEKAGSSGPFVRLDFQDKHDLLTWFNAAIRPTGAKENMMFATFNDKEIESVAGVDH